VPPECQPQTPAGDDAERGWIGFWNRSHRIYANRRHLEAHYQRLLADLRPYLPGGPGRTVLDFGCGDALAAERIADVVGTVVLYDAAPATRARLAARVARHPRITVVDEGGLEALPPRSVDLALIISVVQYLDRPALAAVLATMTRMLKLDGQLLIADVIDPGTPMLRDVASQLRFAAENGFVFAALGALAGVFVSDYRRLRARIGFAAYTPAAFLEILAVAGFAAERLPRNIGPSPHRHAFLARPRPAARTG
jgi:ubiquinone/menaquinone biosynthesis C-methylase UbiE